MNLKSRECQDECDRKCQQTVYMWFMRVTDFSILVKFGEENCEASQCDFTMDFFAMCNRVMKESLVANICY